VPPPLPLPLPLLLPGIDWRFTCLSGVSIPVKFIVTIIEFLYSLLPLSSLFVDRDNSTANSQQCMVLLIFDLISRTYPASKS
jgi:hypothetical protein